MNKNSWIAVSGAYGFIGSCLTGWLNHLGYTRLLLVDDFSQKAKVANLQDKSFAEQIERSELFDWWAKHPDKIQYFFHLGARTDTTETDYEILKKLNLDYSKQIWQRCVREQIPLVYASSAATYGDGGFGYDDKEALSEKLVPLNAYGRSKNEFDKWAIKQNEQPPFWAGLKFFNVYGPNEYHKGRMASVIFHAFNQIKEKGSVQLFRSHNPNYADGGQLRDFIYVKDVLKICLWLMENQPQSGLYNVGTGTARSFHDLAKAVFDSLGLATQINFINTPLDIRDKYQYFTEANMEKLKNAGYPNDFYSLESGIADYVGAFLNGHAYL